MNGVVIKGTVNPEFISKAEDTLVKFMEGLEKVMRICEGPMEFGYNLGILVYGVVRTMENVYCGENSVSIKLSFLSAFLMKMKSDGVSIGMLKELSKEESEALDKVEKAPMN